MRGDVFVCAERLAECVIKQQILVCADVCAETGVRDGIEAPYGQRVEPEMQSFGRAEINLGCVLLAAGDDAACHGSTVAGAVVPERDGVEIANLELAICCGLEVGAGVGRGVGEGWVVGEGGRVDLEEVDVGEGAVIGVCAAEADEDLEDEGAEGQDHGQKDAGETTGFPHLCGLGRRFWCDQVRSG